MLQLDRCRPDPDSSTARFAQLRESIAAQIRDGAVPAGTRLPSARRLAADLGLATNTVVRAYNELVSAGLLRGDRRRGTVVAVSGDVLSRRAVAAATVYANAMRRLGVAPSEALALAGAAVGVPTVGTTVAAAVGTAVATKVGAAAEADCGLRHRDPPRAGVSRAP